VQQPLYGRRQDVPSIAAGRVFLVEIEGKEVTVDSLPLIKVMRHAQYSTHKLLHSLTKALINHKSPNLDLALLVHVLVMLADNRYLASGELINSVFQCQCGNLYSKQQVNLRFSSEARNSCQGFDPIFMGLNLHSACIHVIATFNGQ